VFFADVTEGLLQKADARPEPGIVHFPWDVFSILSRARRERIVRPGRLIHRRSARRNRRPARQHNHARTHLNPCVEIGHIFVGEPDAAGRYERADRRRLVCAVDAVERLTEIESARPKRIAFAAQP